MENDQIQPGNDKEPDTLVNTSLLHEEITKTIIGCAIDVSNELGPGFLESVYEKALLIELQQKGFRVENQYPIKVYFREECVGDFYSDLLVEDKVIVELKAVKSLMPEHKAQVINYLKATEKEVGILINFGKRPLEYSRLTRNKEDHLKKR